MEGASLIRHLPLSNLVDECIYFHTDELQFGDAANAENGKFALVGVRFDKVFVTCKLVDLTWSY